MRPCNVDPFLAVTGAVRPLKTTVFDRDEIEPAFRFMAQGKHIGKVVIQVRPEDESKSVAKLTAHARSMCDPRKSYVVTGGLGGFGLELAHWLVERGARSIVLTSRRGMLHSCWLTRIFLVLESEIQKQSA